MSRAVKYETVGSGSLFTGLPFTDPSFLQNYASGIMIYLACRPPPVVDGGLQRKVGQIPHGKEYKVVVPVRKGLTQYQHESAFDVAWRARENYLLMAMVRKFVSTVQNSEGSENQVLAAAAKLRQNVTFAVMRGPGTIDFEQAKDAYNRGIPFVAEFAKSVAMSGSNGLASVGINKRPDAENSALMKYTGEKDVMHGCEISPPISKKRKRRSTLLLGEEDSDYEPANRSNSPYPQGPEASNDDELKARIIAAEGDHTIRITRRMRTTGGIKDPDTKSPETGLQLPANE